MPTWVIQCVEALAVWDRWNLVDGNKPLFVDHFSNKTDYAATLHEGDIAIVAQNFDEQYGDDDNDCNTDEYPEDPPVIDLEPAAARGSIAGVPPPKHPV